MLALNFKRSIKLFCLFIFFLIKASSARADLPFAFGLIMKPYAGIEFDVFHNFSGVDASVKNQFFNAFYKFENMSGHLGFRIHKFFGIESNIHRFTYKTSYQGSDGSFDTVALGLDFLFYVPAPIIYLDMLGTGVEFYGGIGSSLFIGSQSLPSLGASKFTLPVLKYSAGIQLRLFNKMSMRLGMEYYDLKLNSVKIYTGNLITLKMGISYYFL